MLAPERQIERKRQACDSTKDCNRRYFEGLITAPHVNLSGVLHPAHRVVMFGYLDVRADRELRPHVQPGATVMRLQVQRDAGSSGAAGFVTKSDRSAVIAPGEEPRLTIADNGSYNAN